MKNESIRNDRVCKSNMHLRSVCYTLACCTRYCSHDDVIRMDHSVSTSMTWNTLTPSLWTNRSPRSSSIQIDFFYARRNRQFATWRKLYRSPYQETFSQKRWNNFATR